MADSVFRVLRGLWVGQQAVLLDGTATGEVVESVLRRGRWNDFGILSESANVLEALRGVGDEGEHRRPKGEIWSILRTRTEADP